MSTSRLNSISMVLTPAPDSAYEVEMIFSTPRICCMVDSRGDVRNASTVSGDAPGHCALTVSRGSWTFGRFSMGMFRQEKAPKRATHM